MFCKIKNVVGVSLILIVAFILFIGLLESKFNGVYYEEEECVEAVVIQSTRVLNDTGRRAYDAKIEYITPKGNKKVSSLKNVTEKILKEGDKVMVSKGDGFTRLVKRDLVTWKYIPIDNYTNMFMILPLVILLSGVVCLCSLERKKVIVCNIIMSVFGLLVIIYSGIHSNDLGKILRMMGVGIIIISLLVILKQVINIRRQNSKCDIGLEHIENRSHIENTTRPSVELKRHSRVKSIMQNVGAKWKGFGNKKYIIIGIIIFLMAIMCAIEVLYCMFWPGNYGKYKYADAVIVDIEMISETHTHKTYMTTFEFVRHGHEKKTYEVEYVESDSPDYVLPFDVGDVVKVGYTDTKATIFEKDNFTGKYFPYDKKYYKYINVMGLLIFIGIVVMSKPCLENKRGMLRAIGLSVLGFSVLASSIIGNNVNIISVFFSSFTIMGIVGCCRKMPMYISERNNRKKESEISYKNDIFEYKKK